MLRQCKIGHLPLLADFHGRAESTVELWQRLWDQTIQSLFFVGKNQRVNRPSAVALARKIAITEYKTSLQIRNKVELYLCLMCALHQITNEVKKDIGTHSNVATTRTDEPNLLCTHYPAASPHNHILLSFILKLRNIAAPVGHLHVYIYAPPLTGSLLQCCSSWSSHFSVTSWSIYGVADALLLMWKIYKAHTFLKVMLLDISNSGLISVCSEFLY
jgi:hypothetical protein